MSPAEIDAPRQALLSAAAGDINQLAFQLDEFMKATQAELGSPRSLTMCLIVERIKALSDGLVSGLDDPLDGTEDISQRLYPRQALNAGQAGSGVEA